MFLGTYTPKLDDKGRLTLPAKFRDALAGGLMVSKGQDHSLAVYPREEFEKLARRASQASRSNPDARAFLRNLAAGDRVEPDHADGDLAIGDALDFQAMQAAKLRDLVECQAGILDQPDGGCFGHQRISHNNSLVFLFGGRSAPCPISGQSFGVNRG